MSNLRDELLNAYIKGDILDAIYNKSWGHRDNRIKLVEEIAILHNDGLIDIIKSYMALKNDPKSNKDFFLTRNILEKSLPKLKASVIPVMECVLHLANEAGNDLAAYTIVDSFVEFCAAEHSRPKEALKQIEASIDEFVDLLSPAIIAGTRFNINYYFNKAIQLTNHNDIDIRKRAIYCLGKIHYQEASRLIDLALETMESLVDKENDDHLIGNIIVSTYSLFKKNKSQEKKVTKLIEKAFSKGGEVTLHAISEVFGLNDNKLPDELLDNMLFYLLNVNPQNKTTLGNIDSGLTRLFKDGDLNNKGIEFLETLLLTNSDILALKEFNSVIYELSKNRKLLNRLIARWLLKGDCILCDGIYEIVNCSHDKNFELEVDICELNSNNNDFEIFIARKAIGYLFYYPVSAASIIVSLMEQTSDNELIQELNKLLYDPLLLNYPGKVKEFLIKQEDKMTEKVKEGAKDALKKLDIYFNDLKTTGDISELHPPQLQIEAYNRYFSRLMNESMKKAEKQSVFLSLVSKSVLLYGRKSISYMYDSDGKAKRMEIPLQCHSTEMEFPRIESVDSFGLDQMLRIFRGERIAE